jgi:acyl dehydratase
MTEFSGAEFSKYIGQRTSQGTLVVERAPLTNFATAVRDANPVYRNADAARAAGFADVPAPPTFGFSIQNWGKWEELQPAESTPAGNPMADVMGALMAKGGIVLHGEQEFHYHRPLTVGQRLHYEGVVQDIYQKQSGDRTMTFMVIEDTYRDEDGTPVLTSIMNLLHRV